MAGIQSIDGLASNLNTTDIIDALIKAQREPVSLMEDQQVRKTLEISNFQALSAKLLALQTSINQLNNKKSFSQASISVSDTDILEASAETAIGTGTYSLNVLALAQNHQIASQGFDDPTSGLLGTGTVTLALGDKSPTTITIDESNNSLVDLKNAINDAKTGITASIINDGTDSNAYRLVLTGNQTGQENQISFSSSLSGGLSPNFETATFDSPETSGFSALATSQISLGATTAFTGSTNKTYSFTIGGIGAQTVGTGNIVIDWTDGTDSGSIVVSQADTEVIGPDGLKLSFADGELVAGDTFTVSSFAPVLQEATDARISIGSSLGMASPIVISSGSNTIEDALPGLTLTLKGITTAESGPVTIGTGLDTGQVKQKVIDFIAAYNDVATFIDAQNEYDADTKESGVLMGDITLQTIESRLSRMISEPISGLDRSMNTLSAIGVRLGLDGKLALKSSTKLTQALEEDFEAVMRLFVDSGNSDNSGIEFLSTGKGIKGGDEFDIDITHAATHGYYQGGNIFDLADSPLTLLASTNKMKIKVDGMVSDEIVLTARTYNSTADLVNEVQTRIDADDKIGDRGVIVEWVDAGAGQGYLKFNSATWGTSSKVEMVSSQTGNAYADLGLVAGNTYAGSNVAGTINGVEASGQGQILSIDDDNSDLDGIQLKITLDEFEVADGSDGMITITKGVASVLHQKLDSITRSGDGVLAAKTGSLEKQVQNIKNQILAFDERLAIRRESLVMQYMEMEMLLSQLQSEGGYLESQLAGVNANWGQISGKR